MKQKDPIFDGNELDSLCGHMSVKISHAKRYLHLLATLVSPEPCIAHFLGTHSQTLNSAVWQIAKR